MFGTRLRLARKQAGLSMRALAERTDPKITAQAISKYEAGKMMPSSAVLVGLGKALDVSLDFLMSTQVEALDGLEFRRHSHTSARDRARAEAVLIDNLERYLTIEDILDMPSVDDSFKARCCDSVAAEQQIDAKADELRRAWDLGMEPVPSLCALLEDRGIKVVEANLPERINGLACHVRRNGKPVADAIVVSSRTNVERKRFTLAHELAHRIIRSTGNPAIKLEKAMNRFAGAFLIPGATSPGRSGSHPSPNHLLRNHVPQAHLWRIGSGHAGPPGSSRHPTSCYGPTRLFHFRSPLARDGTGTHLRQPGFWCIRKTPAFQTPRLARNRRRIDLAGPCSCASQ